MSVNADQTFSGDSIFENIYVHGKLVTPEEAVTIFNSILVRSGLTVQTGPSTFGNDVKILGWNRQTSRFDSDGTTGQTGSLLVSGNVDVATAIAVTDKKFRVGFGGTVITADVSRGRVGVGTTAAEQVLDVVGSVKITDDIFDSTNSSGVNGAYLNQDAGGIRWVTVTPGNAASILVQDEGVYLQRSGVAATFTALNFVQENSAGVGTDTLIPSLDADNPNFIGRITTKDLWGHSGTGNNAPIYRMTNVGIQNNNPSSTLDVTGTLHITGSVDFDSSLNLDGPAIFNSTLTLQGNATLQSNLTVQGGGDFDTTLNVDGATTVSYTHLTLPTSDLV